MAMHFKSQAERLKYLKGGFEEIVPKVAEKAKSEPKDAENEKKSRKKSKKGKKDDEI